MSTLIELPDMCDGYVDLCRYILKHGEKTSPRGEATWEVENVTVTVDNLDQTLPLDVGRGINIQIGVIEALQLMAGEARADLVQLASPPMRRWVEPDGEFYGAYGTRIGNQAHDAFWKLKNDRDTRQAVITLWDPGLDNRRGKKDYPCTVGMGFRIRESKLNMSVTMRSSDCWLGMAYDVFQFTQLQWSLANQLQVEPGTYSHHSWSMHVYERNVADIERLHHRQVGRTLDARGLRSPQRARQILRDPNDIVFDATPSENWYCNVTRAIYDKIDAKS